MPREPLELKFIHCQSALSLVYVTSPPGHMTDQRRHMWEIYVPVFHINVIYILEMAAFLLFTILSVLSKVLVRDRTNFVNLSI